MPDPISAITGGSALLGASSASKAAKAQTNAANNDIAFQKETRDQIVAKLNPYYQGGVTAQNALMYEMGLGAKPTSYQGFQASPGYQFALDQGNASVNALAGAKGGLMSGATLQALQNNGIGMANQEYSNYFARLSGLAGSGQNAAAQQGTAMSNAAGAVSNAYGNIGDAKAAGAVGIANAFNSGVNNYLGYQQYQQGLTRPQTMPQPFFGGGR